MSTTSKTATEALSELMAKLEKSNQAVITDLAKSLAEGLYDAYKIYLPHKKDLEVTIDRQRPEQLYSATCTLVDIK